MRVFKLIRWAYEFLVVLYCSLIYVARVHMNGGSRLLEAVDYWAAVVDRFMMAKHNAIPFDANSTDLRWFHEEWFGIAFMTFACVRLLSQVKLIDRAFPVVGLCLTLAGPLYFSPGVSPEWGNSAPRVLLLCLEIVVTIVILFRYGPRSSITATSLCLVATLAHFCLWGWVIMSDFNHRYAWPTLLRYLMLPLCTVLLWGFCAKMSRSSGRQVFTPRRPHPV